MNLFLWNYIFYFVLYPSFLIEQLYWQLLCLLFLKKKFVFSDFCFDLRVKELAKVNLNQDSKEELTTVFD